MARKPAGAAKRKPGRPSGYSDAIADAICERLAGGESLVTICKSDDMPNAATVFRWLSDETNKPFCERYARAREAQADTLAQEILHIANTPQEGVIVTTKEWGEEIKTADMIEHRRLQVDARKWLASKLAPKKYGDKLEVAGDPSAPLAVQVIERKIVQAHVQKPVDPDS